MKRSWRYAWGFGSLGLALLVHFHASAGQSQQLPSGTLIVLQGATLIDGLGGPPMPDAAVVIEGDTIKSVLRRDDARIPAGASLIDVSGKFIIPGLIDSHVHWGGWMGELYVNHGVTSVLAQLNVPRAEREALGASLSAPRLFHSGGRPEVSAGMTDEQVGAAVQQWLQREPNIAWLPDFRTANREIYRRTAEEAHRAGFFVFSHAQNAPDAIDSGLDVVEHIWGFALPLLRPEQLLEFQQGRFLTWATFMNDWSRLDPVIAGAARSGVFLNPTLTYEWGGLSASSERMEQEVRRLFSNPDLSYIPQNLAGTLVGHHRQIKNFSSRYEHMPMTAKLAAEDLRQFREGYRNVQELVRRFVRAGGKVISGTDASSAAIAGIGIHHEMEMLVEAGLTPMQALQASTSWPAQMLAGRAGALGSRKVGAVIEGNLADLVILAGNPLEDITNTKKIERVLKGGKFITPGYHPSYFTFSTPPTPILMSTPAPEISAISPHEVTEGNSSFELLVEGVGFTGSSVVKVDGIAIPTNFQGPRKLRVTVSESFVQRLKGVTLFPATISLPDRFGSPGPDQNVGVFGDHTLSVTVYNPTPEGGVSNSVSLVVRARWHKEAGE